MKTQKSAAKKPTKKVCASKYRALPQRQSPARRVIIDTKRGVSAEEESVMLLSDVAKIYLDHLA